MKQEVQIAVKITNSGLYTMLINLSYYTRYNLCAEVYNVAKYVPYGKIENLVSYLIRRAKENTSIAGQTGRELRLIVSEKRRRTALRNQR